MTESHPLRAALRWALLPAPQQTLFLRACLLDGPAAQAAWRQWRDSDPAAARARLADRQRGARRLLPLLYHSVRRNGLALEPGLLTYLRTATLYEGLRTRTYRRLLRGALAVLAQAGPDVLLLKAPALAATAYERWSLRHCHDIDLLAEEADVPRAGSALAAAGFAPAGRHGRVWRHPSRLPALVHSAPFEIAYYRLPVSGLRERSREITVAGTPAHILAPPDMLAHVCGHAASSRSRDLAQWAADAWTLLAHTPGFDWAALEARADEARLALPLSVMLAYLRDELAAPVPEGVLARLSAARERPGERDAALAGARVGTRGPLSQLLRATPGLGRKARLLWQAALPSPAYVRVAHPVQGRRQLLRYYLRRTVGYLARRLRPAALMVLLLP